MRSAGCGTVAVSLLQHNPEARAKSGNPPLLASLLPVLIRTVGSDMQAPAAALLVQTSKPLNVHNTEYGTDTL